MAKIEPTIERQAINYVNRLAAFINYGGMDPGEPPNFHPEMQRREKCCFSPNSRERLIPLQLELENIVSAYPDFIENIVVQGSYGDYTEEHYSDLDAVVFLAKGVVMKKSRRQALRDIVAKELLPLIYKIDPLQHHGVFPVFPELYEYCYPNETLPTIVFTKSWAIKQASYYFGVCDTVDKYRPLRLLKLIINERRKMITKINMYAIKRFTSHLMVLPTVWLASIGAPALKPQSFAPFVERFPAMKVPLQSATSIRCSWPQQPDAIRFLNNYSLPSRMLGKRWPLILGYFYPRKNCVKLFNEISLTDLVSTLAIMKNDIS